METEPPLSALLYAAHAILRPTLSFDHIPDLLDILSQVERAREFSREHAKWALIWQRFYETRPNPNIRVLQKSDKDILRRLLKPERLDATRRIFVCIIEQVIRMARTFYHLSFLLFRVASDSRAYLQNSMFFICGRTPKTLISYTTTSEFTFPGPMGSSAVRDYITHCWCRKSKCVSLKLGCRVFALCVMRSCGRSSVFANSVSQCALSSFLLLSARCSRTVHPSLPGSYYSDDQSFQDLKFNFIGNVETVDITHSITLYLKKVHGMEQRLQRLLTHHVP